MGGANAQTIPTKTHFPPPLVLCIHQPGEKLMTTDCRRRHALPRPVRHFEGDGPTVSAHACKTGLEGIVSKRKDSAYRFGRSPDWLKMKNVDAPAVKREAEEDCGKGR
jgi:ATP-dependent DNA ligase